MRLGLYRTLGETFGTHWKAWRVLVFTGNDRLARKVGLPVKRSDPFYNGKIRAGYGSLSRRTGF